jgi:capsular exopolysaccharide synthesis family protein
LDQTGYLRLIWVSKVWLLLFAVVAAVVVFAISSAQPSEYESKALGQIVSARQSEGEILTEEQLLSLTNLYSSLAGTSSVLDRAHKEPGIGSRAAEFNSAVSVHPEGRVGNISFVATTQDPKRSAEFANAYAQAYASYLSETQIAERKKSLGPLQAQIDRINEELEGIPAGDPRGAGLEVERQALQEKIAADTASQGDTLRIVEPAVPREGAVAPKPLRNALLTLIAALVLGVIAIYVRDLLFDRYRSAEEAGRDLDLALLGEIPRARRNPALEAFRTLRTATMLTLEQTIKAKVGKIDQAPTILVTGSESGCGKSYVSANLSRILATERRDVVAIDADLRRPRLHETFGTRLSPGLSDLLLHESTGPAIDLAVPIPLAAAGPTLDGSLRLIPAGSEAAAAVEQLSGETMRKATDELRHQVDVILLDSPPTGVVVDPVVLARYADGVLFVIDSRHTRRRDAQRAVEALRAMGAPLLGFVFNRSVSRQTQYDSYRPREPRRQAWQQKDTRV